jgi:DNA topoisomerase-2
VSKFVGKSVSITELPVGTWTNDYKEYLETLIEKKTIVDFREKHTDSNVHFEIDFSGTPDPKILKLESVIRETNMHAFDPSGRIKKYDSPLGIIRDWFQVRAKFYVKRKKFLIKDLKHRAMIAANKSRFIDMINAGELIVTKKSESVIVSELRKLEFYKVDGKYDYLVDMKIASLTAERAEKLRIEAENLKTELEELEKTSERTMWIRDLDSIAS